MDGRLYQCFFVILIDCIGFLMRLPTFVKPYVTFAQGIMVFWNKANVLKFTAVYCGGLCLVQDNCQSDIF